MAEDKSKKVWEPIKNGQVIPLQDCGNGTTVNDGVPKFSDLDIAGINKFYGNNTASKIKAPYGSAQHFVVGGLALFSENKKYNLTYEKDGILKIRRLRDNAFIWSSFTNALAPGVCIMQADGNLVIYGPTGEVFWSSNTYNNWGSKLKLQNNGNLIITNQDLKKIWASNSFDNATEKIQLQNGYSIKGTIKWKADIGMPTSDNSNDWFTIKSYGPTAFEANNNDKEIYTPNGFIGRYLDYKNIGTIRFEPIIKEGDFSIVRFKITDLPLWIPYTFDINMNENIAWTGQLSKPLPPFQIEPFVVSVGAIPQLKFGKYTTAIPYEDEVNVDLTGSWSRKSTPNLQIDPKILQPKPGDPIASPVIKSTRVNTNRVIKH
jgi:hypothetical protein